MKMRPFSLIVSLLLGPALLISQAQSPKVPEVKKAPEVKEAPKVPEVKAPPKAPVVKEAPKVPKTPTVPKVPNVPKVPVVKEPPKIPKVPVTPKAPNVPKVPVVKEAPKIPKVPTVPVVKEAPKVPATPKTPVVKEAPKIPKTPVVAEVPKAPPSVKEPKTPSVPVVKEAPKAPAPPKVVDVKTSGEKVAPRVVKVPDADPKAATPPVVKAPVAPDGNERRSQAKRPEEPSGKSRRSNDLRIAATEGKSDASKTETVTVEEARGVVKQSLRDGLQDVGLSEARAEDLSTRISNGDKEATSTGQLVSRASGILALVGADDKVTAKVTAEIADRKLTDATPGGAADNVTGRAVLVVLVGEERVKKVNPAVLNEKAGRLARSVLEARGKVELVGLAHEDKIAVDLENEILDRGLIGDEARAAARGKLQPVVDAVARDIAEEANRPPSQPGRAAQPPVNNNNPPGPGTGPGNGDNRGPGGVPGEGRGPGRASDEGSDGAGDGTGTGPGPGTGTGDGSGTGSGDDKGSGDDGKERKTSHQVVTDLNGNVISEFDVDLETGEIVSVTNSGTPNPLDLGNGDGLRLNEATGGRLGGQEARIIGKGVEIAAGGGGASGPKDPKGTASSGILFTPEERANAERALRQRRGGGVTDPSGVNDKSIAVTDRDLKELSLKGHGGAKGPTDSTAPPPPQDPNSPLGGDPGAPGPIPSTRIDTGILLLEQINVDQSVRDSVKAGVQGQ